MGKRQRFYVEQRHVKHGKARELGLMTRCLSCCHSLSASSFHLKGVPLQ